MKYIIFTVTLISSTHAAFAMKDQNTPVPPQLEIQHDHEQTKQQIETCIAQAEQDSHRQSVATGICSTEPGSSFMLLLEQLESKNVNLLMILAAEKRLMINGLSTLNTILKSGGDTEDTRAHTRIFTVANERFIKQLDTVVEIANNMKNECFHINEKLKNLPQQS